MNNKLSFIFRSNFTISKVSGEDTLDLFNRLSTNNISLSKNLVTDTIFTNENGKFIDIVSIWKIDREMLMISNSGYIKKLTGWIDKFTFEEDVSISKPLQKILITVFNNDPSVGINLDVVADQKNQIIKGKIDSINFLAARDSFLNKHQTLSFIIENNDKSFKKIKSYFNSNDIFEMSDSEFDSFRIKKIIPTHGNEINDLYNPLEVGIDHLIDFDKGCYIGQEVIARLDTYNKVQRKLVILDKKKDLMIINSKGCNITTENEEFCLAIVRKNLLKSLNS